MTQAAFRTYRTGGRDEFCLCMGDGAVAHILIIPPLFDEMNRMRRVLVSAMRRLADQGIGSCLIDLPGGNESHALLEDQSLDSWRQAVTDCATPMAVTHIAALRGGVLIDNALPGLPHWRLAPVKGSALLKRMIRTRIAGEKESGNTITEAALLAEAEHQPIELAGNRLGPAMVAGLANAEAAVLPKLTERVLGTDIAGSPLWLRAEPQDDPDFARSLANDLARWSQSCGG